MSSPSLREILIGSYLQKRAANEGNANNQVWIRTRPCPITFCQSRAPQADYASAFFPLRKTFTSTTAKSTEAKRSSSDVWHPGETFTVLFTFQRIASMAALLQPDGRQANVRCSIAGQDEEWLNGKCSDQVHASEPSRPSFLGVDRSR